MTLSEIETILEELSARHTNLSQELLTTLLVSAGWEDKTIKEAIVLFNQRAAKKSTLSATDTLKSNATTVTPLSATNQSSSQETVITFLQPDGTEEGELHAFADVPSKEKVRPVVNIEKKIEVAPEVPSPEPVKSEVIEIKDKEVTAPQSVQSHYVEQPKVILEQKVVPVVDVHIVPTQSTVPSQTVVPTPNEPQSLIPQEELVEKRNSEKSAEIPGNLPLLPFESSPHIWSFSKYKDVFHSDAPLKEEIKVISVMPQEEKVLQNPLPGSPTEQKHVVIPHEDRAVIVEATPLPKDDKPLVFLAGTMLLAIILILGYMYSNGRL